MRGRGRRNANILSECRLGGRLLGRIIAVANQKGGVGKTTTAVNLSSSLARMGQRVLLVDMDPQGNSTSGVGVDKNALASTIYDVLVEGTAVSDVLHATVVEGLLLAPATIHLAGAEIELVPVIARETRLKEALAQVEGVYDFIIIDCPPSLGLLTINALAAAQGLLVPIQCEYYALEGVSQVMNMMKMVKGRLNPSLELEGVVLTMFDGRTNLSIQVADEVKRHFRGKLFRSVIPRNVRLSEAPSHGMPVALYDPRSRGAEVYEELAREVMERHGG